MTSIEVLSRTQRIIVSSTKAVSVVRAGPIGPRGFPGENAGGLTEETVLELIGGQIPSITDSVLETINENLSIYALISSLEDEAAARESADTTIAESVVSEATTRQVLIDALSDSIDAEILDRINSITTVSTAVNNEALNRIAGDAALDVRLDSIEALGSLATDSELAAMLTTILGGVDLDADTLAELKALVDLRATTAQLATTNANLISEATTRANADISLQTNIDAEATARSTADNLRMLKSANGSDIADASAFRDNLGLGDAATKTVGTGAGNVVLGNDARLSDSRTPTDSSVTWAKLASSLQTILDAKALATDLTATNARVTTLEGRKHLLQGGNTSAFTTGVTSAYIGLGFMPSGQARVSAEVPMLAGTMTNFDVRLADIITGMGAGGLSLTVLKNGAATALTVSFSLNNDSATDSTHSVTFADGDLLSIAYVADTITPANARQIRWFARYLYA